MHMTRFRSKFLPVFSACLCIVLLFATLFSLNGHSFTISEATFTAPAAGNAQLDFDTYLQNLFRREVSSNTLNLHYSLADPAGAGIPQTPVTLGQISEKGETARLSALENMADELAQYHGASMSLSQKLTYDVLTDYVDRQLALAPFYYYQELLSPVGGAQCEYPVLLAEYAFYSTKDVDDYLTLLSQYDTYFSQLCDFEKQKAKHGLFMNARAADHLIAQCSAFLPNSQEQSFWETTFNERLNGIDGLSKKQRRLYVAQNKEMLAAHVAPAYQNMIAVLKALKHRGKNSRGLCHFKNGKRYYELLVKSTTGSARSIPELQKLVAARRSNSLSTLRGLSGALSKQTVSDTAAAGILLQQNPKKMLLHLKKQMQTAFPAPAKTDFTVKCVSKKLEPFLSPAFYLTAPMDRYTQNCIYINPSGNSGGIELFTTLAHEGYPGHLYQTVYAYTAKLPPVRYLLYHGGYTEGWATYAEMLSYAYAGLDEKTARAQMLHQDASLSLYATIDMGVHYDGWSLSDTVEFLSSYGITNAKAAANIYQAVIETPANYLKYYIGYLEFSDLRKKAETYYGNDFSERTFHAALLNMGTAPFYILDRYFATYYSAALKN